MTPRIICHAVDFGAESFTRSWKRLDESTKAQAKVAFGQMLNCERMPAKLHFHKLGGFKDVWTIHITSDDQYKASFTLKDGVAYMRRVGQHDKIDKNPE